MIQAIYKGIEIEMEMHISVDELCQSRTAIIFLNLRESSWNLIHFHFSQSFERADSAATHLFINLVA